MSDADNLDIKKRARRRLVGAVALALLAAVMLPVMMDQEPHPSIQDIQITIPDRERVSALALPADPAASARAPAAVVPPPEDDGAMANGAAASPGSDAPKSAPAETDKSKAAPTAAAAPEKAPEPAPAKAPSRPPGAEAPKPAAAPARSAEEEARVRAILAGEPVPPRDESFVIQVGAFSDAVKAAKLADTLERNGFRAYTEPAGKVTRVRVGPIAGREAAEKAVSRLKAAGHQAVLQAR